MLNPLGFNEPRMCAQIKSSSSPINVRILRELQGVMQRVNAKQGLLARGEDLQRMLFKWQEMSFSQCDCGIRELY